ncbi:MAG: hypothetical protein IH631_10005 [Candidatus Thorarchaeota archaeon]|nr:hypothetical protein [Candidatus Thorarchaeota archaeon]
MRKSFKSLILLSLVSMLLIFAGASMSIAFPSSTSECGTSGCHDTATLTITSNATGAVNATVGKPFTLNIDAGGYSGGDQEFYVSIESSWADNDQFSFTATSIQDNGAGDLNSNLNEISISVDFTPLSMGTYTLRIWTAGKSDEAGSLDVTVLTTYDKNAPLIDSPADIEYEYLATGNGITWIPSDSNPANYSIFRNGTIVGSGGWSGSSISILVDWLIPGIYEYTLIVNNIGGYFASDTVMVTVTQPVTTTGTSTTITTTTTTTDTTTTQIAPGGQTIGPAVVTPLSLVVGTWVVIILVVILISEILFRKGKW